MHSFVQLSLSTTILSAGIQIDIVAAPKELWNRAQREMIKIQGYLHGAATQGHAELCLQGLASFSNSHKGTTIQTSEPLKASAGPEAIKQ